MKYLLPAMELNAKTTPVTLVRPLGTETGHALFLREFGNRITDRTALRVTSMYYQVNPLTGPSPVIFAYHLTCGPHQMSFLHQVQVHGFGTPDRFSLAIDDTAWIHRHRPDESLSVQLAQAVWEGLVADHHFARPYALA